MGVLNAQMTPHLDDYVRLAESSLHTSQQPLLTLERSFGHRGKSTTLYVLQPPIGVLLLSIRPLVWTNGPDNHQSENFFL
jgi:hypothetical protein